MFSSDGKRIFAASFNKLKIWDAKNGDLVRTFTGHAQAIDAIALNPDGKLCATGSDDSTAIIWNVETGEIVHKLVGQTKEINSVAFSPDGRTVATGSADKSIVVWEVAAGRKLISIPTDSEVRSLTFSHDGSCLVAAGTFWDAHSGKKLYEFKDSWPTDVKKPQFVSFGPAAFSGNEQQMAVATNGCAISIWDARSRKMRRMLAGQTGIDFNPLSSVSPDARSIAVASGTHMRLEFGVPDDSSKHAAYLEIADDGVLAMSWSLDSKLLACAGNGDPLVKLWDVAKCQAVRTFTDPSAPEGSIMFSPDGQFLLTVHEGRAAWRYARHSPGLPKKPQREETK